jgi:hypothetical protein
VRIDDEATLHHRETLTLVDSITHLTPGDEGSVVVAGSHAGAYSARVALRRGVRAAIMHDAGIGLHEAGIAGLAVLDREEVAGVAVAAGSCLIGSAREIHRRGVISHVNSVARELGCVPGLTAREAVDLLSRAAPARVHPDDDSEARHLMGDGVWALDSASLVRESDAHAVVVTGSHGELLGGVRTTALKVRARGAVFNDAGRPRGSVPGRLVALAADGVPAATVGCMSARIGSGVSTYQDGVLSHVNGPALELGASVGMSSAEFVRLVLEASPPTRTETAGKGSDVRK